MELLDQYIRIGKEIHEYFGYQEDWVVIPIEDSREYFWHLTGRGHDESVRFAETVEQMKDEEEGEYYEDEIYTQRFLPKWVYRGPEFTMVCVDTHCDGNKFLRIFDNTKEVKEL